jgi:hypothetical protein
MSPGVLNEADPSLPESAQPRMARRSWAILIGAAFALASIASYPVFVAPHNWGIRDWDQHLFYHHVARAIIVRYHQMPLWNPWACGGMPLLANPQSRVLTPGADAVLNGS